MVMDQIMHPQHHPTPPRIARRVGMREVSPVVAASPLARSLSTSMRVSVRVSMRVSVHMGHGGMQQQEGLDPQQQPTDEPLNPH